MKEKINKILGIISVFLGLIVTFAMIFISTATHILNIGFGIIFGITIIIFGIGMIVEDKNEIGNLFFIIGSFSLFIEAMYMYFFINFSDLALYIATGFFLFIWIVLMVMIFRYRNKK